MSTVFPDNLFLQKYASNHIASYQARFLQLLLIYLCLLIKLGIYQEDKILIYEMVIIMRRYDVCNGAKKLRQQQRIIIDIDCQYTYPN